METVSARAGGDVLMISLAMPIRLNSAGRALRLRPARTSPEGHSPKLTIFYIQYLVGTTLLPGWILT